MSFRIEEKLLINFNHIFEFKKWLSKKKYLKLYPDRKIKSLYFENLNNQMFIDQRRYYSREKIKYEIIQKIMKENFFRKNFKF